jgi:hypothetical protein
MPAVEAIVLPDFDCLTSMLTSTEHHCTSETLPFKNVTFTSLLT